MKYLILIFVCLACSNQVPPNPKEPCRDYSALAPYECTHPEHIRYEGLIGNNKIVFCQCIRK